MTLPIIPPIADSDRYQSYNITSPMAAIGVAFPVFGDGSDLTVYINGVKMVSGWAFSSLSGVPLALIPLPIADGQITFTPPLTTGFLEITGAWHPRQNAVPTAPGITRYEYAQTVGQMLAGMRELWTLCHIIDTRTGNISDAAITHYLDSLPTTLPPTPGKYWWNGQVLCVS